LVYSWEVITKRVHELFIETSVLDLSVSAVRKLGMHRTGRDLELLQAHLGRLTYTSIMFIDLMVQRYTC